MVIYFLPTFIGLLNPKSKKLKLFILNLTGGWTVVYWVAAFFLAFASTKNPTQKNNQGHDSGQQSLNQVTAEAEPLDAAGSRESRYTRLHSKGFVMTRYIEPTVLWWRHLP